MITGQTEPEMETGLVDRHRSNTRRVEILRVEISRPDGSTPVEYQSGRDKPVETAVKFSFLATRRHLSTNRNIHTVAYIL